MKKLAKNISIILAIIACVITKATLGQATLKSNQVKQLLILPFGTIAKMNIEIIDGDKLDDKGYSGAYLFKIKTVDSIKISKPIIIEFKDEMGKFPADEFQLYKYLYGRETESLTSDTITLMKKEYVGKGFTILAYETGEFSGVPDNYFKYQPVRQDRGFYFRHYIIVVANLTKKPE